MTAHNVQKNIISGEVISVKKVIVIGGNAAGMSAASQIKRQQPQWSVVVFEKGDYISYASCGISYLIEGSISNSDKLVRLTPQMAVQERNIDLRLRHEVTMLNPAESYVEVRDTEGVTRRESFDFLVISTGCTSVTGDIEVTGHHRVFTLKNLSDGIRLNNFRHKYKPKRAVVIGAGNIAIEMLEAFKSIEMETCMVHRRDSLARLYEKEISRRVMDYMEEKGIDLKLNRKVVGVQEKDDVVLVETSEEQLTCDLVVLATGVRPQTDLLAGSGVEAGIKETVKVNALMQTNYEHIYAAGDCAETMNIVSGKKVFSPLALKANKEGYTAGINISGGEEMFPGTLESAITKFFDMGIARTGLTVDAARESGFAADRVVLSGRSRADYYPGGGKLQTVLTVDSQTARVLGAQLSGPVDAVKRVDVYAAAITARMTVDDLFNLDLAYAPPFSPVYDPVVMAGRISRKKRDMRSGL